jgi:hypothetical protein
MAITNPFIPSHELATRRKSTIGFGWVYKALSAIAHAWRAFIRYKRLARMSDQALAARGLSRSDIARHAYFGDDDER